MHILKRLAIIFAWVFFIFAVLYYPSWRFVPTTEKSINVFVWGDALSFSVLSKFEKETGIKVNLSYYATNEELQVKMQATSGVGYDLIMPSNYTTEKLAKKGLLKPLDLSKIQFKEKLNPLLLNLSFDPSNQYSIPYSWEVYGLGYDRNFFANGSFVPTWKAIYDKQVIDYRIAVQNDPIEAVAFAAFYLFGQPKDITSEKFLQIKNLLLQQREWVEAYSDFRAPYFIATGNCPVAVTSNSYIRKIHGSYPNIDFALPKEGSFITIENFCIPKASTKEKYVYKFLNYLYTKESMTEHFKEFGFFPAYLLPYEKLSVYPYEKKLLEISPEEFSKLHFITNLVPQQQVRDLWVEVKSY
ncbi:MAG: extracellular solute-binding protein [Simkaniaceae bacterium]|nr:extracellular solute-binding protein [Candidatus Sacchlamyda saccharinae]